MSFSKIWSGLVIGSIAALTASPAFAQVFKDADGSVYVAGQPATTPVQFVFSGVTQTKSSVSNACGGLVLRGTTSSPLPSQVTVGGSTIDLSSLPQGLLPTCSAGNWNIAPTGNLKTPDGRVLIVNQTPNTAIQVSYEGTTIKRATANACGIAKIKSSASFTVQGTFQLNGTGTNYDVSGLPSVANPDICRNGIRYQAVTGGTGGLGGGGFAGI